jgi:hypothetical protein
MGRWGEFFSFLFYLNSSLLDPNPGEQNHCDLPSDPDLETLFSFLTIHAMVANSWQKFPSSPSKKKFSS